jgi:hypothetical protein
VGFITYYYTFERLISKINIFLIQSFQFYAPKLQYKLPKILFCDLFRVKTPGLDVNQILDILEEEQILDVEDIYLQPPEGDDSDGYDLSDTEEGHSGQISRTILQVWKF